MTREQFKLLPVERVVALVWSLAEAHGELGAIIRGLDDRYDSDDRKLGRTGQLTDADRQRWNYGGPRRPSSLRYASLSRAGAVLIAGELVALHPRKTQIRDLLVSRLDEQVGLVIDAINEDLDRLAAVA